MYVLHIQSVLSSYHKYTLEHISIQSFQLYLRSSLSFFIRITCLYLGYYYFMLVRLPVVIRVPNFVHFLVLATLAPPFCLFCVL
jgi:hypothetical protein